ncbi:MAG TPA: protein kinase [Vicinamibacteria bacterium]
MPLEPGRSLGHYQIVARLGAGGMGEVWRATDTRLSRDVAIKVLPKDVASDPDRLARFRREAQLLAALNHPSVAAIHGIEEAEGQPFLVLELVPGEDLSERLKQGPIPLDEALPIARQIAEALEEAHERGIVHRDLKPANVKVTPDGKVKVLDFGLAKAWGGEPGAGSAPDLSASPTLAHTGTAAGVILGTAAYMSPEQARGKPVDKRSDIWAFGALLHEMLTGRQLFAGETVSDVLAAVLTREPDWGALPAATPASLRVLLRRCLERDPKQRLRDIGEARVALQAPGRPEPPPRAATKAPVRLVAVLAAAAAALAFAAGYAARRPAAAPQPLVGSSTVVRQLTFEPGLESEPSLSPDGNYVAYTTNERGSLDVAVMPLAGGEPRFLAGSSADEAQAAWSPDGSRIAFTSARDHGGRLSTVAGLSAQSVFVQGKGGDVFIAPAAGGPAVKLVEHGAYPSWSRDGRTMAFQSDRNGQSDIWTVPAEGGEPRRLTDDRDIDYQPSFSPDGKWIVFGSLLPGESRARLRVVPGDGSGPTRELRVPGAIALAPAWSPSGDWIYFAASQSLNESRSSLWRLAFSSEGGAARVERLTLGETIDTEPALSAGGRLAYGRALYSPDLHELDVASGTVRQLTSTSCVEDFPHLSPDGRTLVFYSDRSGGIGIHTLERDGGTWQRLSSPDVEGTMPRWAPDGRSVAFVRSAPGDVSIVVQPVGSLTLRTVATLPRSSGGLQAPEWSPDGRSLAFTQVGGDGRTTFRVADLAGTTRDVATVPGVSMFASWSPDGGRLVFQRELNGPRQIWVLPVEGGEPTLISRGNERELSHPQWSARHPDRVLVVVDHKNLATLSVSTGAVTPLTRYDDSTRYVDYPSWSPDGTKVYFSMVRIVGDLFLLENLERP